MKRKQKSERAFVNVSMTEEMKVVWRKRAEQMNRRMSDFVKIAVNKFIAYSSEKL